MTNIDTSVPEPFAVIAAFLDGEHVDAGGLKQALSTDEGREYLVDVLALRQSAARMGPVSFPAHVFERKSLLVRWSTAAAIAVVASAFGYLAGGRAGLSDGEIVSPSRIEAVADLQVPAGVPEPTHVIRLTPGVNWHVVGGN